jgi:hypothetical protein
MEPRNSRMQQIKLQGAGIPFAGPMVRIRLPPAASGEIGGSGRFVDTLALSKASPLPELCAKFPSHSEWPEPELAPATTPLCNNSFLISRAVSSRSA